MVKFRLNGQEVVSQAQANKRLLDVLRQEFWITGLTSVNSSVTVLDTAIKAFIS